jgi:DNA polymerase elongation subunit (family B)
VKTLTLDVETVAALDSRPNVERQALAEMAVDAAAWKREEPDVQKTAALSPVLARIAVLGLGFHDGQRQRYRALVNEAVFGSAPLIPPLPWRFELGGDACDDALELCDSERGVLARLGEILAAPIDRIVTFSGRRFDLPLLIHRTIANGLGRPELLIRAAEESRYRPGLHHDVQDLASFHGAASLPSLRALALAYGLGDPKGETDGSEVEELVSAGDVSTVARYCLSDVWYTERVARRWHA